MHSDKHIVVITGPNFTNLARLIRLMILTHLAGINAESERQVSDAGGGF